MFNAATLARVAAHDISAQANNATSIQAGRLGSIDVRGDEVLLGMPLVMTNANIDQYDF